MWDFDPAAFDFGGTVDFSSFDLVDNWDFIGDAGDGFDWSGGFDMGGVNDFADLADVSDWGMPDSWDGSFDAVTMPEWNVSDFGTVWEADFPLPDEGWSLGSLGNITDIVKGGQSIYAMTQYGSQPAPPRSERSGGPSPSTAQNVIRDVMGVVRDGLAIKANIEDTQRRIDQAGRGTTANPNRGMTGPRPGTQQGSARMGNDPRGAHAAANGEGGLQISPLMIGVAGIGAFLLFKG